MGLGLAIDVIPALTGARSGILAVPALVFGVHQSAVQTGPVGLLSVGGGFVIVPALQGSTDLDIKSVVATSLAVIALVSGTGVV